MYNNKFVCFNDFVGLMTMVMRLEMKNNSQRNDISRPTIPEKIFGTK